MQILYCLTHNSWTLDNEAEKRGCFIVTCPPPELPKNWMLTTFPPSDEELAQMDVAAEELRNDFIGA